MSTEEPCLFFSGFFSVKKKKELNLVKLFWSFPGGSDGKESTCNARDLGSIPRLRRSSGEGNGYPLQYSCLENLMDTGAWWATMRSQRAEMGIYYLACGAVARINPNCCS